MVCHDLSMVINAESMENDSQSMVKDDCWWLIVMNLGKITVNLWFMMINL